MSVTRRLLGREPERSMTLSDYAQMVSFDGQNYLAGGLQTTLGGAREETPSGWLGYIRSVYLRNGVVFACMEARAKPFSEARFQFQQIRGGRPGDLFGSPELGILEEPWPNGTTGDLLGRMIQDADLAGNFYAVRRGDRLHRLCPDYVTIVCGRRGAPLEEPGYDAEVLGYLYKEPNQDAVPFMVEEVAHWAPRSDPSARYRGISWITAVIREIMADGAATGHKLKFFENGATPNLVITTDPTIRDQTQMDLFIRAFKEHKEGLRNAYSTIFLRQGSDAKVVGSDLQQMSFKETQGAGETRIAAAAGVPPVIVGLSEGLQQATYSNYEQAKSQFADGTLRPLWRGAAAALSTIIPAPAGSRLWYDDRDIAYLREDSKKLAEIQAQQAVTLKTLIEAGVEMQSAIDAILAGDLKRAVPRKDGMTSVQLQLPGATGQTGPDGPPALPPGRSLSLDEALLPILEAAR